MSDRTLCLWLAPLFLALLVFGPGGPAGCGGARAEPTALASEAPAAAAPQAVRIPRVPLTVRETAGVARAGEVIRSGIPLPRSLGLTDPRRLAVVDADGRAVPADFQVLARWNAGIDDAGAPIQWVLVVFPATVGAKKQAVYSLVTDGSVANPRPPVPLTVERKGDRIVVDTGAAVFSLGGAPGALFDEVRARATPLVTGSEMTLLAGLAGLAGKTPSRHSAVRKVRIEHAGPLSAVVVVEGAYDLPPVGKGGLGSLRRYVFTAGSPTALVRQSVAWEGNLGCNGCITVSGNKNKEDRTPRTPNAVRLEQVRDTLSLSVGEPRSAVVVGAFDAPALIGTGEAWVRQDLRPDRETPLRFEAAAGPARASGKKADGGMLAVSGPAGAVAVAFNHLHRYEPQGLRLLSDGRLALDLAAGPAWLAHHQGMFATFAVAALPPKPARADLDREVWAPLNHPLRAWPDAAWFAGSDAVGEIPVGPLPKGLDAYDRLVPAVLERTVGEVDRVGLAGLMTFGVFPRYWGGHVEGDIRCKDDPTPGEPWDDLFWCARWTDYHDTLATAPLWAMRSGQVEWLDELAVPGALRTLHTQILQCAPDDPWFYCGQAPTGYGAYRTDFNSSHAYFENLFLYYWLTGDSTVVETLRRGGENMRRHMCASRASHGPACGPDDPPAKASFNGRVASQWLAVFRFLGLASGDASFLDDWRSGLARAVTHEYLEVERDGKRYGFFGKEPIRDDGGTYIAGPIWVIGFYDAEGLYRLMRDTDDAPIGDPPVRPSHVLAALARSLADVEARTKGDWPRQLAVTWEGARIGGRLQSAEPVGRDLFSPEKSGSAALLARAARLTGDPALLQAGRKLVDYALKESLHDNAPLGKLQGQYLTRLHAAVAELAKD
jgi:hypothetical protein